MFLRFLDLKAQWDNNGIAVNKSLAYPIILGALALHGTAFFEIWTAPGLESLPTYSSLCASYKGTTTMDKETGIFPVGEDHNWLAAGVEPSRPR